MKKNWLTAVIIAATVVLGGVAIVTTFKLYQIGQESVAPTAPKPIPAQELLEQDVITNDPSPSCQTSFSVAGTPGCYEECQASADCPSEPVNLECQLVDNVKVCVNPGCAEETDCQCPDLELACWDECVDGDDCGDYECQDVNGTDRCVNPSCDTETDCECPDPEVGCWDECDSDADCSESLRCQDTNGTDRCVNPSCDTESDCQCPGPTNTPTPTPKATATPTPTPPPGTTATPTPQPELPEAGFDLPTFGVVAAGFLLIVFGLLLAL